MSLPGEELVVQGIADLAAGKQTIASLLVSIGHPRLANLGLVLGAPIPEADHRLYSLLSEEDSDSAHSRYNALVRRLVSYERAAESAS